MSVLPIEMTATEAKMVTTRIRGLVETITSSTEKVVSLIEQAEAGRAWSALGYDSWTAYVAAEFSGAMAGLQRAERVPITAKLAETGMSSRAIAPVVGVSDRQVRADVQVGSHFPPADVTAHTTASNADVTGLDGKRYVRNGRPTARGMQELADAVPAPRPARRRKPLPDAYRDAVYDLDKVLERLVRLTDDDRFASHADDLYHRYGGDLERLAERLHDNVKMPLVRGGDRDE
jgi:hypothetical protein